MNADGFTFDVRCGTCDLRSACVDAYRKILAQAGVEGPEALPSQLLGCAEGPGVADANGMPTCNGVETLAQPLATAMAVALIAGMETDNQ
jgi:hypothetical protein